MLKLKPSLIELLRSSFQSIFKNKIRTFLTSLGIIIGVTSVILLISIGNGLKAYINQQFESLGANNLYISPGKIFTRGGHFNREAGFSAVTFTPKDVSNLEKNIRNVDHIIPVSQISITVKQEKNTVDVNLIAIPYDYADAQNQHPSEDNGRWFTRQEEKKKSKVVILGAQVATDLFDEGNPLGRKITVSGKKLKIIGILDKIGGGFGGGSLDTNIYVPTGIGHDIIGNDNIQSIFITVSDKDKVSEVKNDIEKVMLKKHDEDAFSVYDQSQILTSINSILSTMTMALSGIAAISLVVGGIGIMNIMLVTVTERTREIGLRKAVGAYPGAILLQFLFEAVILSAFGGTIGIILGSLGAKIINNFFPAQITVSSIVLAFGVSSLVGIIFGVAPARKASKLSPIVALRYE